MATRTPKEIAAQFGTDAKTLRKFLRKDAKDKGVENPGKGQRWAIEANQVKSLKKRFDAWDAARTQNETTDAIEEDEVEAPDAPETE